VETLADEIMTERIQQLELTTVVAEFLGEDTREEVICLCNRAYGEDMRSLMATFHGATHVLGRLQGSLVTHALWVTRWLQVGDAPLLRTAYVEAVATDQEFRRRGLAQAVMEETVEGIQDFDIAGLSPFSVDYYGRLGWELWRGALFIRSGDSVERSPEDEEVMIYRLPRTPELDLSASLSAEWREGELW
jgi:aminoglycoside 2'-N-acetyltransferase I